MSDEGKMYCKADSIEMRLIPPGDFVVGKKKKKKANEWVHISLRTPTGQPSCGERVLTDDDVELLTTTNEA